MSAENASLARSFHGVLDARERHVLRYALGATLAMAIAMGLAWDLSFLVPVLSLTFLATKGPPPGLRQGLGILAVIGAACFVGLYAIKYLLQYPLAFFLVFGLAILRIYLALNRGVNSFLVLWLFIALTVLPLIAVQSPDLASFVVRAIILGASVTLLVVWITHALIPDPPPSGATAVVSETAPADGEAPTSRAADDEAERTALTQTLVVYPLFLFFQFFELTGAILVLVFVVILSMQPGFAKDFKRGSAMIVGNLMGGVAAIVVFNLLTVVPRFGFLLLLTLLCGLFFGSRLLSDRKTAPLYGMAYSTLLLVVASVTSTTGDAASKVYSRIFQIILAVSYVVVAFGLVDRFRRTKRV